MAVLEKLLNPFPGLRPFEADEAHLFFGRDGQSDELLKRLRCNRFVAVVGTSGSGKSSLVRAGLLPSLYGGFMVQAGSSWRVAMMRPGNHPIGNLAEALSRADVLGVDDLDKAIQKSLIETTLRRGALGLVDAVRQARPPAGDNLLIVVDQFEELFRFKQRRRSQEADDEAAAFVKLLLEAAVQQEAPVYIVLTMRSDYLGDCAQFRDLPEAINNGQYLIPRMTRDQRREAIEGPVAVGGATIAPRLVNRLLNDVGDNPDQLPLLQHALMRMWLHWEHQGDMEASLDLAHYKTIGEMTEALSLHADEAYDDLGDAQSQEVAEKIFKCLTEKGSDNRETRRPTTVRDLCAITGATEAEVIAVIESFRREGRSFLTPPPPVPLLPDRLIDISHESLIRNWQRLKRWVEGEGLSASIYRRLAETSVLHRQEKAGLWRDPDLQIALSWRDKVQPNRAWGERYHREYDSAMAFLDASRAARDAEAHDRELQRKRELRRTRLFAIILGTAFLLASALGVFAFIERDKAEKQRGEAERQRINAEDQTRVARQHQKAAEEARQEAEDARREADRQKTIVEQKQNETAAALQVAKEEQQKAEAARVLARKAEAAAIEQKGKAEEQKQIAQLEALRVRKQNLDNYSTIVNLANALIAKSSPQEGVIWRQAKATALSQIGNHQEAIAQATLTLKSAPTNLRARFERSYNYLTQGEAENALRDIDVYLAHDANFWAVYQNQALALGLTGRYAEAAAAVSKGLDTFIHNGTEFAESEISPDIQLATRRKVLMVSEQTARLALHYEQATLKACAGDAEFEQALQAANRQADQIAQAGKAKEIETKEGYLFALNWAWMHGEHRKADYGALASQGALWERAGYKDWAWKYYTMFEEEHQRRADGRYNRLARWVAQQMSNLSRSIAPRDAMLLEKNYALDADMLAFQAQELLIEARFSLSEKATSQADIKANDKFQRALQLITEALQREPNNIQFLFTRALINSNKDDYRQMRDDCDRIIQIAPRTSTAYYLRYLANTGLGITGDPISADLRKAVEYDPANTAALIQLSDSLIGSDAKESARLLEQGLRSNTDVTNLATLYLGKAVVEFLKGNYPAAQELIETAIQTDETNLSLYDNRALIEAKGNLSKIEIARHQVSGYSRAADIKQKLGRSSDALDVYRRGLGIFTGIKAADSNPDVRQDVAAIIRKISQLLTDLGSKEQAAVFWRTALETGYLKGYEEIVHHEITGLAKAADSPTP